MTTEPLIAFGQQPCGIFPRRFLYAKIQTARRLQSRIGGRVVFFCHDSDHDPRETRTILRHRRTLEPAVLNFAVENKLQRKFAPAHLKRIAPGWQEKTTLQLPNYVAGGLIEIFRSVAEVMVADFCLAMYRRMGLLEGIDIVRSSDPDFRRTACSVSDFFVDVPYEGEVVRARFSNGDLCLHEGGDSYITLPCPDFSKSQITPSRDTRLRWMQSVLRCTHYVLGAGEQAYLRQEEAPGVSFVIRDTIERADEAFIDTPA